MTCNLETGVGLELQELERHIEGELGVVGSDNVAAFALEAGEVIVALELGAELRAVLQPDALASAVFELALDRAAPVRWVVLVAAGDLPRTPQGTPDRETGRALWHAGRLAGFALYEQGQRRDVAPASTASTEGLELGRLERELAAIWSDVLGVPEPAASASFFALGGSSVDAVQVATRVRERLGLELDLQELFEAPTLSDMARALARLATRAGAPEPPIAIVPRTGRLALSPAQARMRFAWQLDPRGAAYNICGALELCGVLDMDALARAFSALAERHESLRTRFPEDAGETWQQIDPPRAVALAFDDLAAALSTEPAARREARVRALLEAEAQAPFDLERGPLWRARVIRLHTDRHVLCLCLHHAIADGASMDVLVAELCELYAADRDGRAAALALPRIQYADYALWQTERLGGSEGARQLEYWTRELAGDAAPLALPTDRARPVTPSQRGERVELTLDPALCARARDAAREHGASLFMLLLAAFDVLLARYSRQSDVRVGVPATGRVRLEAERLIGACVNTLVMRARVHDAECFAELLAKTRRSVLAAQSHQELPFDRLVEALAPEREPGVHPLFQVMFNHQQRQLGALAELPGLRAQVVPVDAPVTRFDLSLSTEEDEHGRIRASLVYAADLFERERIEQLGRHFVQLLAALLAAPTTPLGRLSWLSEQEERALQTLGNAPRFSPPAGSVEGWIRRRAAEQPGATALVFGADTLAYGELDRRAEALGRRLTALGAGPERIVAVLLERQLALPVVLLAILKTGAAYLPLDPEVPESRLAFQLDDAGVGLVVTQSSFAARVPARPGLELVVLDDASLAEPAAVEASDDASADDVAPLAAASHPESIAYVLYTSGSTGLPKAVASTRAAMAERLAWMQHQYELSAGETLLHKTPLTFDVAVWEVFLPLIAGARLVIAPPGAHKDPRELARLIVQHEVGTIHFVPSLLREFVAEESSAACLGLRRIFSGGEALSSELALAVQARWPEARVDNRYGPTEALINASYWTCRPDDVGPVPIGVAIPNGLLRVVDPSLGALPPGLPGELCIGGSCLARGYLSRPSLTAERFVPDPLGAPGARLYRTGDLARFRPDGAVEFLGRQDEQVKIRGVRLELGELEGALQELEGVMAAAAHAWPRAGGAVLVAYVVAPASLATSDIEVFVAARLPAHLVPSAIVRLEVLPRLPSGKLDRRRLPEPVWQTRGYEAPRGVVATRVAAIWQEVLNAPRVGLLDDFFALGGHSLLATRVVSRVRRELDVELPLRELFEARDLGAFVARVQAALDSGRRARQPVPERVDRSAPLPLSYAQERMWFLWSLEPESAAYNVGGSVRMSGALNVGALEAGLAALQARHEALRTTFPRVHGVPVQRIAPAGAAVVSIRHEDLAALPAAEREAELRRRAQLDASLPFDLESGPLFRVTSFRLAPQEHVLVITLHHIIAEGWAMDVFAREYVALYEAFDAGHESSLPALPVQYAEYAVWQRRWLESGEGERQLDYWRRTLGDEHPVLELPADRPRPASPSYRGEWHRITLGRNLTERVEAFAVERGVTVPMLLTTALLALLYRYTGERRLRVGYPIANRVRPEFEGLIGAFLNTQVLACEVGAELSLGELLTRVLRASIEAQSHQDVPFHQIVDALAPERSASHTPLFQVMCNVQSWEFQRRRVTRGLELEFVENDARAAQFELALDASQVDGDIQCAFSYSVDRFELPTIESYARHWTRALAALVSGEDATLGSLELLDAEELGREQRWAQGARTPLPQGGVHELFEARAAQAPEALALIAESVRWSYAELEARANQLARALLARGVRPGDVVGCCGERAPETLLALLGIAKAGAAYLPLDPGYPVERLRHMVNDSGARLVLIHGWARHAQHLQAAGLPLWPLDAEDAELRAQSSAPLGDTVHADSVAYCIYTSGSTGVPKGVACTHRGLANRTLWLQGELGLGASDRVLARNTLSFDVSLGELLAALASGATLVLAPAAAERDPAELARLIREHAVTTVDLVPALLDALVRGGELAACPSLRALTVGGEALPRELSRACLAAHPARLYNMYGPTEAAVDVACWRCREDDGSGVPIGSPMANVELFVLDARLQPVPPLVSGELYVGGAALALGYLGRAAETARRFIPHPWARGERLYRTGDLVRRRADGVLEFIGRVDAQVKVRGHRIELGEIEARLSALESVREAVVSLGRGPSGARLVAHVALADAVPEGARALRAQLAETLPDYMIPADIVVLRELPRLSNGKLDRKALPAPEARHLSDGVEPVAPETESEQRLAEIWREVLGVERVGVDDNFFELGGDSIISLQVVHRARERGLPLSPRHLFQHQTVRALAAALPALAEAPAPALAVTGSAPLTPMQRRFFAEEMPERAHYNHALLLRPRTRVAAGVLRRALELLVAHHDALRFRYVEHADGWRQTYAEAAELHGSELLWELTADDAAALAQACQRVQRAFDLERGPLLRAALIEYAGGQRLLLAAHHLVVDGVSWRILLEDLGALCQALGAGQLAALGTKTTSFRLWGEALEMLASEPSELELAYWLAHAERAAPRELPRDREQGSSLVRDRATAEFRLDAARTAELLRGAPEAYRTQVNDLLLAALARALCRFAGDDSVWIELESHGRQDCFDGVDLSRSVGWFTSAFPVCFSPALGDDDGSLESAILTTKDELRAVPRGGLGFGVYAELGSAEVRARLARTPRARVTFNYLGQLDQSFGRGSAFELAAESPGPLQSDTAPLGNWLGVLGQVSDERLEISLSYSREMYDKATIASLALSYRRELELLIAHALKPEMGKLSPADFPLAALGRADLDGARVRPRDVADIYPLTPMQQGLLFHAAYNPGEDVYVCQVAAHVDGLDPVRFADAWQAVAERHEILRTSFHERRDGGFFQVVHRKAQVALQELDLRGADVGEAELASLAREERSAAFELNRAPLMRLLLARLGEDSWRFIWTHHHVLMDGWSSARVLQEVLRLYAGEGLGPRPGSYREYVEWISRRDLAADERFWRSRLAAFSEPTLLASSLPRRGEASGRGERVCCMSEAASAELGRFARRERITLSTLVQGAWLLLLSRYTGQASPVFGATVAGRPVSLRGAESRVGLFINTVPVVGELDPSQTAGAFLRALSADGAEMREHEHTPLHEIQRWAGLGGQSLFDSIVVFENYPLDAALGAGQKGELRFDRVASVDVTSYAVSVMVHAGERLRLRLDYSRQAFDDQQASALALDLERLVLELARAPERRLGALPSVTADQLERLARANATQRVFPVPQTLHAWVEQQCARTPQAVAAICGERSLTYADLNERADRLAEHLRTLGVGPDVLVGLCLERSLHLPVAMLGILKAGGAYVPLDPEYPLERLSFMMQDSGIRLLVSERRVLDGRPTTPLPVVLMDEAWVEPASAGPRPVSAPSGAVAAQHLAYCIYTSGSTGQPKGVEVTHGSLVNFLASMLEQPGVTAEDRILGLTSLSFDISALEIYLPWCAGGAVVLVDRATARDPVALARAIDRHGVTLVQATPSTWRLLDESGALDRLAGRRVLSGGEALPGDLARRLSAWSTELWNVYGPTETTVWSSLHRISEPEPEPLIGRPLANTSLHVLGATLDPVPGEAAGELYIGGDGLARGYHGRPSLTAARFVPDPFASVPGARMYRTGDLVRRRDDGSLEYLGRLDHQVKIRGHRIELGEIEARLLEDSAVRQAVVVAQPVASGAELVAYVVAHETGLDDGAREELAARLVQALRALLPAHMVPGELMLLGALPLTQNGKIDRRALPKPGRSGAEYVAPSSELGTKLAQIWREVLDVERVGLNDNFFNLGGHSLLATRVISRIHTELAMDVPLRHLFETQSLEHFERAVQGSSRALADEDLLFVADLLAQEET